MKTKLLPSREERWEELMSKTYTDFWTIIKYNTYHEFLKRKPKLYMFVPCDDNGNVLEKPDISIYDTVNDDYKSQMEFDINEYQQALERVIFDGFGIIQEDGFEYVYHDDIGCLLGFDITSNKWLLLKYKTLADLVGKAYVNENGIKDSGI